MKWFKLNAAINASVAQENNMQINNIWTEKYRPKSLSDFIISDEYKSILESFKQKSEIPNLLLIGNAGIGKTTLSKIIVNDILKCQYLYINASDENGIDIIRTKITNFAQTKSFDGKIKIIILDEADGLSGDAQRCLRNTMEEFLNVTRFILTGNYKHKIIEPIQSRCQEFDLTFTLKQCANRCVEILNKEKIIIPPDTNNKLISLIRNNYPDLRKCINELQKFSSTGTLIISDKQTQKIVENLYQMISLKKKNDIRKFLIENESSFGNDYQNILRGLFNYFDQNEKNDNHKQYALIVISEHLYRSSFVVDQEINCYACILQIINGCTP